MAKSKELDGVKERMIKAWEALTEVRGKQSSTSNGYPVVNRKIGRWPGMIRGTTPTLEFVLPFDTYQLAEAFVTLSQREIVVIDKSLTECECNERKLSVRLTQEETLKLDCNCITEIQVRVKTLHGDVLASRIIRENTERILKDGVI